MTKRGRREKELLRDTLGGEIRHERSTVRGVTTEELGFCIGVTNQQISFAEQALEKIPSGTFARREKHEKREHKGYSDQLVFAIAQELGKDFGEPVIKEHLEKWQQRIQKTWGLIPGTPKQSAGVQTATEIQSTDPTRISKSEEIVKKIDALPPAEREEIERRVDEAYRRHQEQPAGRPARRMIDVAVTGVNTAEINFSDEQTQHPTKETKPEPVRRKLKRR